MLLANTMHLDITAEGVEHAGQLQLLRTLGCPAVQGYLFGAPISADNVLLSQAADASAPDLV